MLLECHCWVVDFQRGFGKTEICYCSFLLISYLGKSGLFCWSASSVNSSPSTCRQQLIFFLPAILLGITADQTSFMKVLLLLIFEYFDIVRLALAWTIDNSLGFQLWDLCGFLSVLDSSFTLFVVPCRVMFLRQINERHDVDCVNISEEIIKRRLRSIYSTYPLTLRWRSSETSLHKQFPLTQW